MGSARSRARGPLARRARVSDNGRGGGSGPFNVAQSGRSGDQDAKPQRSCAALVHAFVRFFVCSVMQREGACYPYQFSASGETAKLVKVTSGPRAAYRAPEAARDPAAVPDAPASGARGGCLLLHPLRRPS